MIVIAKVFYKLLQNKSFISLLCEFMKKNCKVLLLFTDWSYFSVENAIFYSGMGFVKLLSFQFFFLFIYKNIEYSNGVKYIINFKNTTNYNNNS